MARLYSLPVADNQLHTTDFILGLISDSVTLTLEVALECNDNPMAIIELMYNEVGAVSNPRPSFQ